MGMMIDETTFVDGFSGDDLQAETTGRYIVVLREDAVNEGTKALSESFNEGTKALSESLGVKVASSEDFKDNTISSEQLEDLEAITFANIGVAVVNSSREQMNALMEKDLFLAVEPERVVYAMNEGYLRGYRDGVSDLVGRMLRDVGEEREIAVSMFDEAKTTWGLQTTRANVSRYSGKDIKIAVLDTGLDLQHPDFKGRTVVSASFIKGQTVDDNHGHGTHCIGSDMAVL